MIRIRRLNTARREDRRAFVGLAFRLYEGAPQWVPPVLRDLRHEMNRRRHPFYDHSVAEFFVVEDDAGEVVGRVSVADNHNRHKGLRTAFFAHFESVNDAEVVRLLLETAAGWAVERGLDRLSGPRGFLPIDGIGVLIEGFEHRPAMGFGYHLPYYGDLISSAGFEKEADALSGYVDTAMSLPESIVEMAAAAAKSSDFYDFHFPSRRAIRRNAVTIGHLYNRTFVDNYELCPLTDREMRLVASRFVSIADPKTIFFIKQGDDIAAFVFILPDVTKAIQRTGGRLFPFGWVDILREARRTNRVNIVGFGVLPEYRGMGADLVGIATIERDKGDFAYDHADVVQIEEGNRRMMRDVELAGGVTWVKRHRVFTRAL